MNLADGAVKTYIHLRSLLNSGAMDELWLEVTE